MSRSADNSQGRAGSGRKGLVAPRHWPIWFGVGVAWLVVRLPVAWLMQLGGAFGALGWRLAKRRRHIVETNLALCFPELVGEKRATLAREVFRSTGIAFVESAMIWLGPVARLQARFTLTGLDIYRAALAEGNGVIVIGAHFTTLDLAGGLTGREADFAALYRPHGNPVLDRVIRRGRERHLAATIQRRALRRAVAHMRKGGALWYAPDQDYGLRHAVFVPFFGIEAATINVTTRLARRTSARVLFLSHRRDPRQGRWEAEFSDPFHNFPSDDFAADAAEINRVIEQAVRQCPEQYLWVHRRFKTRPPGEASFY
ncbi:MAG: LpxL/LpxP family Kdo(2)-lipid IV(A) lauroyl/palmitoleoyl acyltransferase [Gammaproteobacteria bacterium]|nr:LpxL/LpxP family Kdo(2)-lipid IV(A) lauroyl/palmitoleoyl acyltransferase [Gammaproteobacteria bacterium]